MPSARPRSMSRRVRGDDLGGGIRQRRARSPPARGALSSLVSRRSRARPPWRADEPARRRGRGAEVLGGVASPAVSTVFGGGEVTATVYRAGPCMRRAVRDAARTRCRRRRPRAPRATRSALVTSTPIPDAAARRAAETLVAAPPVPTLFDDDRAELACRAGRRRARSCRWAARPAPRAAACRATRCRSAG